MAVIDTLAVIVIAVLATVTIVIFIAVLAATVLVTGAVHTEERRRTLAGTPPGPATRLARRLLAMPDAPARGSGWQPRRVARPAPQVRATWPNRPAGLGSGPGTPRSPADRSRRLPHHRIHPTI